MNLVEHFGFTVPPFLVQEVLCYFAVAVGGHNWWRGNVILCEVYAFEREEPVTSPDESWDEGLVNALKLLMFSYRQYENVLPDLMVWEG